MVKESSDHLLACSENTLDSLAALMNAVVQVASGNSRKKATFLRAVIGNRSLHESVRVLDLRGSHSFVRS